MSFRCDQVNKKLLAFIVFSLLFAEFIVPFVLAIDAPVNLDWNSLNQFLRRAGGFVYYLLNNTDSREGRNFVYLATFILFLLMLYAIYAAALRRISLFQSGEGLSKNGKIVAWCFAGLSVLAIFWQVRNKDIVRLLVDLLSPFGVLAGIVVALVVFLLVWQGFREEAGGRAWEVALVAAGLAMIVMGMILAYSTIWWLGWLAVLIGLLLGGLSLWGSRAAEGAGDGAGHMPAPPPPAPRPSPPPAIGPERRTGNRPNAVLGLTCDPQADGVHVSWRPNEEAYGQDEYVQNYQVQRMNPQLLPRPREPFWRRQGFNIPFLGVRGHREQTFVTPAQPPEWADRNVVRGWWAYRVRAVNAFGKGPWTRWEHVYWPPGEEPGEVPEEAVNFEPYVDGDQNNGLNGWVDNPNNPNQPQNPPNPQPPNVNP